MTISKKISKVFTILGFTLFMSGLLIWDVNNDVSVKLLDVGAVLLLLSLIIDWTGIKDFIDRKSLKG